MVDDARIRRAMRDIIRRLKRTIRVNKRWISRTQREWKAQSAFIRRCSMQNEIYGLNSRYASNAQTSNTHSMRQAVACTTTHFPYYPYEHM